MMAEEVCKARYVQLEKAWRNMGKVERKRLSINMWVKNGGTGAASVEG